MSAAGNLVREGCPKHLTVRADKLLTAAVLPEEWTGAIKTAIIWRSERTPVRSQEPKLWTAALFSQSLPSFFLYKTHVSDLVYLWWDSLLSILPSLVLQIKSHSAMPALAQYISCLPLCRYRSQMSFVPCIFSSMYSISKKQYRKYFLQSPCVSGFSKKSSTST